MRTNTRGTWAPFVSRASVELRRLVDDRGPVAVAREIGVSHPTVIDWSFGRKRPSDESRDRIERWSTPDGGEPLIPRGDWDVEADHAQEVA